MPQLPTNSIETVAIDSTGELAHFRITGPMDDDPPTVGLNIDGDASASYAVDVGSRNDDADPITWFTDEATYSSTTDVSDAWIQTETYMRIRVTSAATAGSEATLYVAKGV